MSNCEPTTRRIEIVSLPVCVTDDRHGRIASRRFLFREKRAPAREWNTEHREIVRSHDGGERAACIAFLSEADHGEIERHRVGEDAVLFANIAIGRVGKSAKSLGVLFVLRKNLHQLRRLRITRWRKEHRVHQTEDRRVGANAERQDNYRRNREPRRLKKLPDRKLKILNHGSNLRRVFSGMRIA